MHFFFSVGEPSGDHHAAHLMQELRSKFGNVEFSGFGGKLMEEVGYRQLYPLADNPVMGIAEVLPQLFKYIRLVKEAKQFLAAEKPDAVILVDAPAFNWHIAKAAKGLGIPVFYYMPPQLWAWAPWRIRKVRKYVDHILAALPFEADWYRERGVDVECVGHPFIEQAAKQRLDVKFITSLKQDASGQQIRNVALLPGSRTQEVKHNFPIMLRIADTLAERHSGVRFRVACFKESHRLLCQSQLQQHSTPLPIEMHLGKTSELIELADCALAVSGSVSLELLARTTPTVVMYRSGAAMGTLATIVVTAPYMSLPNLIAGREVMPEFPFVVKPQKWIDQMTAHVDRWLSDPVALSAWRDELRDVLAMIPPGDATARAAGVILERLGCGEKTGRQSRAA